MGEESYLAGILSAVWFGILTSVSPCPLATNIAAISFIGNKIRNKKAIFLSGLLYTLGRLLAYILVAVIILSAIASTPQLARFLQKYLNIFVGPVLIIVGFILLDFIKFSSGSLTNFISKIGTRAEKMGIWGSLIIGFVFALSFCPVSAGLFFGTLIPLSISYNSQFLFPAFYGIGTALPVILFSIILGFGASYLGSVFNRVTAYELWARKITGMIFILAGIHLTLLYIFKINILI